jgi:SAM-dependent methyltransferase
MQKLKKIIKRFVPARLRAFLNSLSERKYEREYRQRPIENVFSKIFESNRWRSGESISGPGSELDVTRHISQEIPKLIAEFSVQTFLDVPCGDFNWMKTVDLSGCQYIGGDIVPQLIEQNQKIYGDSHRRFLHIDLTKGPLPFADMLLCRDCFIHLSFQHLRDALASIRSAGIRYLLTTTYPEIVRNDDIVTGLHRPINLCLPPFNFPSPVRLIIERPHASPTEWDRNKSLGLWPVSQLPDFIVS